MTNSWPNLGLPPSESKRSVILSFLMHDPIPTRDRLVRSYEPGTFALTMKKNAEPNMLAPKVLPTSCT